MKKFIFVCLVAFGMVFSSCSYQQHTVGPTEKTDKNGEKWLSVECFQTLTNNEASSACLAMDNNWNIYYITHITPLSGTKTEVYYDGKRLDGNYVFVGTFSYENKNGDAKTIQAYMPKENYYWWYNYDKEALKRLLDCVLSYDSVR